MPFCVTPCFALKVDRKKKHVNIVCTSAIYLTAYVLCASFVQANVNVSMFTHSVPVLSVRLFVCPPF